MNETYDAVNQGQNEDEAEAIFGRPERRRTVRGRIRIPLFVYGHDSDGGPFYADAETIDINAHGALIATQVMPLVGDRLLLTNKNNLQELPCTVVSALAKEGGQLELSITFDLAAPWFWFKAAASAVGADVTDAQGDAQAN